LDLSSAAPPASSASFQDGIIVTAQMSAEEREAHVRNTSRTWVNKGPPKQKPEINAFWGSMHRQRKGVQERDGKKDREGEGENKKRKPGMTLSGAPMLCHGLSLSFVREDL
jgi:hypothetical protein